jgi:hypothetical protein
MQSMVYIRLLPWSLIMWGRLMIAIELTRIHQGPWVKAFVDMLAEEGTRPNRLVFVPCTADNSGSSSWGPRTCVALTSIASSKLQRVDPSFRLGGD